MASQATAGKDWWMPWKWFRWKIYSCFFFVKKIMFVVGCFCWKENLEKFFQMSKWLKFWFCICDVRFLFQKKDEKLGDFSLCEGDFHFIIHSFAKNSQKSMLDAGCSIEWLVWFSKTGTISKWKDCLDQALQAPGAKRYFDSREATLIFPAFGNLQLVRREWPLALTRGKSWRIGRWGSITHQILTWILNIKF